MLRNLTISLFFVIASAAHASAPNTPSVTLTVDPAVTVAGVPTTFRISVTNNSATPATLPRDVVLVATPAGGEPFVAKPDPFRTTVTLRYDWIEPAYEGDEEASTIVLPPRTTITIEVAAKPGLADPEWFQIHEEPGRYRLKLLFSDGFNERNLQGLATRAVKDLPDHTVVSSETTLTVQVPAGADAAACAYMREVTGRQEPRCPLVHMRTLEASAFDDFLSKHGQSTFGRALVGTRAAAKRTDRIAQLDRAAREGLPPFADWHRLHLAQEEAALYFDLRKEDILRARRYLNQAQSRLALLVRQTKIVEVRHLARRELAVIDEYIREFMTESEARQP